MESKSQRLCYILGYHRERVHLQLIWDNTAEPDWDFVLEQLSTKLHEIMAVGCQELPREAAEEKQITLMAPFRFKVTKHICNNLKIQNNKGENKPFLNPYRA